MRPGPPDWLPVLLQPTAITRMDRRQHANVYGACAEVDDVDDDDDDVDGDDEADGASGYHRRSKGADCEYRRLVR